VKFEKMLSFVQKKAMSELILKYNQLDEWGRKVLFHFIDSLLKKRKPVEKPKMLLDYDRFQFPVSQLKFDRDEINSRDEQTI
jgi:hypothetical protein